MTARRVFRLILLVIAIALAARNFGYFGSRGDSTPASERREPVVVQVPPEAIGRTTPSPRAGTDATAHAAGRDLSRDESAGGHTIARHVGKSDADLRARLARERRISAASTYTDLGTAQRVVAAALEREAARVRSWTARQGGRPNLALDYSGQPGEVIGRSIAQGDDVASPCHDAVVVLKWDEAANDYYVLTSYPEIRRGRR